jgi:serine/threonine protein kinase
MSKLKNLKFFIREYKILKQIGEGSYASIFKVQKDNSNEIYVLKQIPITEEDLNDTQNLNDIKNESLILSKIHSPYIVKFYDSFFHNNSLNIITEYCSSGDLCDYIQMYIAHKKK